MQTSSSLLGLSLGQIARDIPGATAVLHKYKLDFCCGGAKSLQESLRHMGLAVDEILLELFALQYQPVTQLSWNDRGEGELIEHILTRYHAVHRQQFPELVRLSRRVELVHREHPACPTGLAEHLEAMNAELLNHMLKEEEVLFPMLQQGRGGSALMPITMMRHEHDEHAVALARIETLTHGLRLPPDACNTWRALYAGLDALKKDLMEHIHLENKVLFTRHDGRLGSFAQH